MVTLVEGAQTTSTFPLSVVRRAASSYCIDFGSYWHASNNFGREPGSVTAWFVGVASQFFDRLLSNLFKVKSMYFGKELMEPTAFKTNTARTFLVRRTFLVSSQRSTLHGLVAGTSRYGDDRWMT